MSRPVRLRLSRAKGFDLQAWSRSANGLDAVVVSRPSRWGNRFVIDPLRAIDYQGYHRNVDIWTGWPVADAKTAVEAFREMQCTKRFCEDARSLRDKNLACWCGLDERWCHADVLLDLANGDAP